MGVTHLQSYSPRLEEEERALKRVGGEEGAHLGVKKMEFHSKYRLFRVLLQTMQP